MKKPKPRTTKIIASKKIKGLFYEGFKRSRLNEDDLIVAFYYRGERFDLHEIVEIEPLLKTNFKRAEGKSIIGMIIKIDPSNERGEQQLVVMANNAESSKMDWFKVTEIKKSQD
jgi:hypothetical protein